MFDLTFCRAENCPKKIECYRYMGEVHPYYQSYADFRYICKSYNIEQEIDYLYPIGQKPVRKLEIGKSEEAQEIIEVQEAEQLDVLDVGNVEEKIE